MSINVEARALGESALDLIASTSAPRSPADGRRLSPRATQERAGVASRKTGRIAKPSSRSSARSGRRCGSEPALRTSTAIAMRLSSRRRSKWRKSRRSSGGRLSTQKKPASSRAWRATDLPEPDVPVTRMISRCAAAPGTSDRVAPSPALPREGDAAGGAGSPSRSLSRRRAARLGARGEHLLGVRKARRRQLLAAEHARDLRDPGFARELRDRAACRSARASC